MSARRLRHPRAFLAAAAATLLTACALPAQVVRRVADIDPRPGRGSMDQTWLVAPGIRPGEVFVLADDGLHGTELWRTDGTAAGTAMVVDLNPGPADSEIVWVAAAGLDAWILVGRSLPRGLWRSDGTAAGTVQVLTAAALSATRLGPPAAWLPGGDFLLSVDDLLWRSDGTVAGSAPLGLPFGPFDMLHDAGGGRFFVYGGGDLYRTDGTAAGSSLVASGLAGVYPAFGGLVTIERGAASTRLRVLGVPGTPSVTVPEPANTAFGADAVLLLGTTTLWSWDGRSARQQLASFASMQDPLYGPLAVVRRDGAAALFLADDGVHGLEPWWTDFTPAGTRLLVDLTPGAAPSRFEVAIAVGERLMFWVRNPATGSEPWSTDGTAAGTAFVGDLEPGPGDSVPDVFSGAGAILSTRRVVFPIQTSATGIEPWITDGTAAGTRLLADLNPGAASSTGYGFSGAPAGGALVFAADDGRGGREPWMIELEGAVAPVPGGCRTRGFYAVEDPVIGAAWPLYAGGVPAPGAALLAQPARAPIDLGERCTLVLDPATSVVLAPIAPDPQGRWAATFPIPNDPGLRGAAFVTQAAWLDPARPLGIELSQAFWLTVGL